MVLCQVGPDPVDVQPKELRGPAPGAGDVLPGQGGLGEPQHDLGLVGGYVQFPGQAVRLQELRLGAIDLAGRSRIFPSMIRVWTSPNRSPTGSRISRAWALAASASSMRPRSCDRSAMLNRAHPSLRESWAFSASAFASSRALSPSSTRSCWLRTMPR